MSSHIERDERRPAMNRDTDPAKAQGEAWRELCAELNEHEIDYERIRAMATASIAFDLRALRELVETDGLSIYPTNAFHELMAQHGDGMPPCDGGGQHLWGEPLPRAEEQVCERCRLSVARPFGRRRDSRSTHFGPGFNPEKGAQ